MTINSMVMAKKNGRTVLSIKECIKMAKNMAEVNSNLQMAQSMMANSYKMKFRAQVATSGLIVKFTTASGSTTKWKAKAN